ncbi:hypothetical protein HAHE_14600 [Haloferula helveola]|uniref:EF-hand domain-containing protein n=1 Tax=Haloferula helveola TaxID=490095 RepID=A0ABM7R8W0_9BACT|nr:hypothetical protein HAHE_14600 [Haloferula helveola]
MKRLICPLLIAAVFVGGAQAGPTQRVDRKFDQADLNKDQFLDAVEWLRTQGRRASQVLATFRFNWADANSDDRIDRTEFRASRGGQAGGKPDKLEAFQLADADHDGFLDPLEFSDTQPSTNPWSKTLREFSRRDRNDDSLLSPSEFGIRRYNPLPGLP